MTKQAAVEHYQALAAEAMRDALPGANATENEIADKHTHLAAKELLRPAKTQGELMSYRQGYAVGLAAGKRSAPDLVADVLRDQVKVLREALEAMLCVMDRGPKPDKLDAALSWRACDEKARAMARTALERTK